MVSVTIKRSQILAVQAALGGMAKGVKRECAIAVNAAEKATVRQMAKTIAKQIKVNQSVIKKSLKTKQKATAAKIQAIVELSKTSRIPLRDFGARENKKGGVSYQLNRGEGRKTIASAFMWTPSSSTSTGKHVFMRIGPKVKMKKGRFKGRMRQRIAKLYGASPWGVFAGKGQKVPHAVTNRRLKRQLIATEAELKKQIEKRINYLKHKAAGTLRGKQPV